MKILAIDIGGTYIKYAYMNESFEVLSKGKIPTPQTNKDELLEAITGLYKNDMGIDGIAISMPGIIDSENGYCVMGGALRYNDDFYFRRSLYEKCPVPINLENDAKCAALAEAAAGSLKDVDDGFVIILGTMVGGGYIQNKRLHRGKHFSAGEVSYINTMRNGYPSEENVWGNRCGALGLCKMYAKKAGLPEDEVNGILLFERANQGDEDAIYCLQKYCMELAVQIFNIQTVLDVERFAIGGGISAQPLLMEYIRKSLRDLYANCPYFVPQAEVVPCKFQNDANLIGAVQCFLETGSEK